MGIQSQADRRLKKSKSFYQRTNSQTFKMFDEAQIKEFKEIFGFLDQDGNGVIEVDDLVALHGIMGKPADETFFSAGDIFRNLVLLIHSARHFQMLTICFCLVDLFYLRESDTRIYISAPKKFILLLLFLGNDI